MVKDQKTRHVFDCTAAHFWTLFLTDAQFQKGLYKSLKLNVDSAINTEAGEGDERRVQRVIVMRPERNLPGFLEKLIKGASQVRETNTYDPNVHSVKVEIELPVVGRRTVFYGKYTSRDLPDGRFERTFDGHCEVKIPLLGRKLEGFFIEEMLTSVDKIWRFTQQWLREHPPETVELRDAVAV